MDPITLNAAWSVLWPILLKSGVGGIKGAGEEGLRDYFKQQAKPEPIILTGERRNAGRMINLPTPEESGIKRYLSSFLLGAAGGASTGIGDQVSDFLKKIGEAKNKKPQKPEEKVPVHQRQYEGFPESQPFNIEDFMKIIGLIKDDPNLLNQLLSSGILSNRGNNGQASFINAIRR